MNKIAENMLFIKHLASQLNEANFIRNSELIINTINESSEDFDFNIFEYIVETFTNGNKTHAKEFYSELSTYQKQYVVYNLGLNKHSEIYNFITTI